MNIMPRLFLPKVLLSFSLAAPLFSFPFQFDFNSLTGAMLNFNGNDVGSSIGTFQFTRTTDALFNPNGNDFVITSNTGGWPGGDNVNFDLRGLQGRILGTFGIQSPISVSGGAQTASVVTVAGPSIMELYNNSTLVMTAALTWDSLQTAGTSGTLNSQAAVNLSNFQCVGSCSGNLAFLAAPGNTTNGRATVTFQNTTPPPTLSALTADGTTTQFMSYSGTATVPEPGFYGVLALGLGGLSWFAARRRRQAESV